MQVIKEQLSNSVQEVLNGNFSALELYAELTICINEIKEGAELEAEQYKGQEFKGYEINVRNGYVTYNYEVNDDYRRTKKQLDNLAEKLKQASKMGMTFLDEESGEMFEPCPIKSSIGNSITFKKVKI